MVGQTLSHYRIIEKIGEGGMGEVYLAEDSRLDRKVALKILPEHLSERADRRERFEREARAVSSLNHPHICTLHDIGEQDGIHYLVMEHLEGESLAARLKKGALPLDQTLEYAIQIADALDRAHRQGVVHRDLKPDNIMLTKSGAKLLDFGLAKLRATEATQENLSALPTEHTNLTAEGTILGTLQYMAPEQLEGKDTDSRTDIFAFGAVVYEMATGKKAFEGKSQASLIAAIMGQDPRPMSELQPMTPQLLDWVVKKCLAKQPDERVQSAHDVMQELKWVTEVGTAVDSLPAVAAPAAWKRAMPWSIAGAIALIAIIWSLWQAAPSDQRSVTRTVVRLTVELPERHQLAVQRGMGGVVGRRYPPVAISRDGSQLAFAALDEDGVPRLYLRALDSLKPRLLSGTENAELPFFSPDGQWVGFLLGGQVSKVSGGGGVPIAVGNAPLANARGAAWAADETIVLGGQNTGLVRMDAATGATEPLTQLDGERVENYHAWPYILPDDEHALFTVVTPTRTDLAVLTLATGEYHLLEQAEDAAQPHYLESGHLVFFRPGGLFVAPFSLSRLAIDGPVKNVPVGDLIEGWESGLNLGYFAASVSGSLVFVPGTVDLRQNRIVRVDRTGSVEPLLEPSRYYGMPAVSPDGARLIASDHDPQSSDSGGKIFLHDLQRRNRTRMTPDGASISPVWSADGTRIFFTRFGRGGHSDLYWLPADGSGGLESLADRAFDQYPTDASRDGRLLVFDENHPESSGDIYLMSLDGNNTSHAFATTSANEQEATFSPDSRFLAYVSNETGRDEIYVRPLSGDGGKTVVSTDGGRWPRWSPAGNELFYMQGTTMVAVPVTLEPSFRPGTPEPLFEGNYERGFDVFPDGRHFAMLTFAEADLRELEVVLNWSTELEEKVPTN